MDALEKLDDGALALETPPDPRTGAIRVVLDPLEWIHRITAHIPDPGSHCQRFYGAYSNRGRVLRAPARADYRAPGIPAGERDNPDFSREARSTWARLVRKIFEADPLTCGACGSRMRIVSFITDPRIVDRIRSTARAIAAGQETLSNLALLSNRNRRSPALFPRCRELLQASCRV